MNASTKPCLLLALVAGCNVADDDRSIDIAQPNELGAHSIVIERSDDQGNRTFLLRAYSDADHVVASVRVTTGDIEELAQRLPGGSHGSEIVVTAGGDTERMLTHETQVFRFHTSSAKASGRFLALPAVARELAREANLSIVMASPADVSSEQSYNSITCNPDLLLVTPVAQQCCYTDPKSWEDPTRYTMFVRPSDHWVSYREGNPYYTACTAADGISSCSGTSCYYGPLGFARAGLYPDGDNPVIQRYRTGSDEPYYCSNDISGYVTFGTVTGNNPTNQNCPGGDGGANSTDWDY